MLKEDIFPTSQELEQNSGRGNIKLLMHIFSDCTTRATPLILSPKLKQSFRKQIQNRNGQSWLSLTIFLPGYLPMDLSSARKFELQKAIV